ncbi:MAG: hypothetical protein F4X65_02180 [Chloroflexi bacterium]|nr:hypothetical protein [Chloroflexota bacterium]
MDYFRLKACGRCGGDLARDDGDWICLQCGAYSYVGLYLQEDTPLNAGVEPAFGMSLETEGDETRGTPQFFGSPGQPLSSFGNSPNRLVGGYSRLMAALSG